MKPKRTYLYDGVYARFDGFQIVLEADNESGSPARIYLEPEALSQLVAFADRVFKRVEGRKDDDSDSSGELPPAGSCL